VARVAEAVGGLAARHLVARGIDDDDAGVGDRERGGDALEGAAMLVEQLLGLGVDEIEVARPVVDAAPSQPNRPVM